MTDMEIIEEVRTASRLVQSAIAEKEVERLLKDVLRGTQFAHKTFAVGGYIRDEIMGLDSKDLDIAVEIKGGAKKITRFLHQKFPDGTSRPANIGQSYPIWLLVFKSDVEHKGEVFKTEGASIDFADTQSEKFPDPNSRQREVEFANLEKDVERRDFTVNMLLRDLTTGELKDLTGQSRHDIDRGMLTLHPSIRDLTKPFREDALRILRLVRFQVKYGWDIPLSIIRAVRSVSSQINTISGERIRGELSKIAELGKLAKAIKLMRALGILKHVFPEIERMRGVDHDLSRGHHQEGDVYKHTYLVLKHAKPTLLHQFAALLHDVGKPDTQEILSDKIQFLGHEKVGAEIAEAMLNRLRFEKGTRDRIVRLVRNHMRPHNIWRAIERTNDNDNWDQEKKSKVIGGMTRKFIRKVGEDIVDTLLDQAEADVLGNLPPKNYVPELRKIVDEARNQPAEIKPVLNGREIMKLFGMKSGGPIIREINTFLLEQQDEDPNLTKKEAEKLVLKEFADAKK